MPSHRLRLGTRASALARWQADWVAHQLTARGHAVDLVLITTQGDAQQTAAIGTIGGQGVFTKALQQALLVGEIDLAVHSLKDLPTDVVPGLALASVPPREAPGDALIGPTGTELATLPRGARVGTGSLRRRTQLLHVRPDLVIEDIRGNVDTRLRKLDEGAFDAIVLAEAGLSRLGWANRICERLSPEPLLPAVGQGALGIECRADDMATQTALAELDDLASHQAVLAERSLLASLRGGCLAPIAAWARIDDGVLTLDAAVLSFDGATRLVAQTAGPAEQAIALGAQAAKSLLAQGAAALIDASRKSSG